LVIVAIVVSTSLTEQYAAGAPMLLV